MDLVTDFRTWGGVHTASYFAQQDVRPNEATREILTDFRHTSRDGTAGTGFKYNPNKGIRGECTSMEDYSSFKRTYEPAFEQLGIKGKYSLYDFRTTYGTELCEAGLTSKQVGDMMGHADARMVETVYGRRRHEGIMKQRETLNELNEEYAS